MIGWLVIGVIFVALAIFSRVVTAILDAVRFLAVMVGLIANADEVTATIEQTGDMVASVAGIATRYDTLTCPRCRRAWPLVTFIGRTRCPGCGSLVLGWQ